MFSLGLGTAQACGHVDYYPNSGKNQPGCDKNPLEKFQLEHYDIYNGKSCISRPIGGNRTRSLQSTNTDQNS